MNFSLFEPSPSAIRDHLETQRELEFTYGEVGLTRGENATNKTVDGYVKDHNHVLLGHGEKCFANAKEAVRSWQMFNLGWVRIADSSAPIEPGTLSCVVVKSFGVWTTHVCRIIYTIEEFGGEVQQFGFGYGTLPAHAERGEERFSIQWNRADDSVWYDLLAFSTPNNLLAKIGYPLVRRLQKCFAHDSKLAMLRATSK
jgi:uncharacterized protein (UPF0548 family)